MEIAHSVAHVNAAGSNLDSVSTSSCDSFLSSEIELAIESDERTPLLARVIASRPGTVQENSAAAGPAIYTKECLNWRIIGLLLMFITGMVLATYLLWRQTTNFPDNGYKLNLIRHDIWSKAHLHGQALLESGKVVNVFVTHTASEECNENCAELLHRLQAQHLGELPYNFLMAGDCETYEARGWQYDSSFGTLPQGSSLVLAFVGNFSLWLPSSCQLQMAEAVIWESLRRRKLQLRYELYALRNVSRGMQDADALQRQLMQWPLYASQWIVN